MDHVNVSYTHSLQVIIIYDISYINCLSEHQKHICLNRSSYWVHRYDDSEDEMEPEMEEAFEHFCRESERKRQQ